jgi:hypothetical protein
MHSEYATAWPPGDAEPLCEPLEPDEELAEAPLEEVLELRCATVGVFAPPPHPAATSARTANPALSLIAFISSSPKTVDLRVRPVLRDRRLHHGE